MVPEIRVSHHCWGQITTELERVAPREGLVVPLVALELRDPDANPCQTVTLEQLATVTIASVVLVPRKLQRNQLARVSVLDRTDDVVGARVEALVTRYPRLRACAYLHSHPFARGSTRPSHGPACDFEGHMLPLLESNRATGLAASFSFIACRSWNPGRWRLQGFGLDQHGDMIDLGFARVLGESSPELADLFLPALARRPMTSTLLRRWRRDLRRRGLRVRSTELFGGWTRLVADLGGDRTLVTLVPIEFPVRAPQVYLVDRGSGRAEQLEFGPDSWVSPHALARVAQRVEECHDVA